MPDFILSSRGGGASIGYDTVANLPATANTGDFFLTSDTHQWYRWNGSAWVAISVSASDATKLAIASNLSDLANAGTARTNIGLGNVDNIADNAKTFTEAQITNLITDLAAKAAKTAAGGPYGSTTSIPGITVNADGSLSFTSNALVIPRPGGFGSISDSYSQLPGDSGTVDSHVGRSGNYTRRLAASLGISPEEAFFLGQSGAQGSSPYLTSSSGPSAASGQGVGTIFFAAPDHLFAGSGQTAPRHSSKAMAALWAIKLGINDPVRCGGDATGSVLNSYKHGMRTRASWLRASRVYTVDDTSVAIVGGANVLARTGTWTTKTDRDYVPKKLYWSTSTNADALTVTLPATLKETATVCIGVLGNPNSVGILETAITTNVQVGAITVDKGGLSLYNLGSTFPQSGQFLAKIDNEQVMCTAAGNVLTIVAGGRAQNGTVAATHAVGAVVSRPTDTSKVTCTGSATNAGSPIGGTGSAGAIVSLAGQGSAGDPIQMVIRIPVSAVDAGKNIVLTYGGHVAGDANEFFMPYGVWFEDTDAPGVQFIDQADFPYATTASFFIGATATAFNAALTTIAAEFDANVTVVGAADYFARHYGATVQTTLAADNTLNHTGQVVHVTPVDATLCEVNVGTVMRSATGEEILLGGTRTQISPTDWSFSSSTRNYNGVDSSGAVAATNAASAAGVSICACVPFNNDRVHPSGLGHVLLAMLALSSYAAMPHTARQIANSASMVQGTRIGVRDQSYLPSIAGTRSSIATGWTLGTMFGVLIDIDDLCAIIGLAVRQAGTGGSASAFMRLGLYEPGQAVPGDLIADLGLTPNAANHAAETKEILLDGAGNGLWIPRKRGLVVAAMVVQGAAWATSTVVACTAANGVTNRYTLPEDDPSVAATGTPIGWTYTNTATITGALPQKFADMTQAGAVLAKPVQVPIMYAKIAAPQHD